MHIHAYNHSALSLLTVLCSHWPVSVIVFYRSHPVVLYSVQKVTYSVTTQHQDIRSQQHIVWLRVSVLVNHLQANI